MKTDRQMIVRAVRRTAAVFAICAGFLMMSCSDGSQSKVSEKIKDKKAYNLGMKHGREVIAVASDEDAVQDALLEVRARITNISDRIGPQSAHDYEAGFTDCIRQNCDSLARVIF